MKKEFTMKELLKRGVIREDDQDFRDDGNKFKGYSYNGLKITYLKPRNEDYYYLDIHINYYEKHLQYSDIPQELFKLADEFNGCNHIDPDKFIENCETIIKCLAEVEEKVNKELEVKPDTTPLKEQAIKEIELANKIIKEFKASEVIYKLDTRYEAGTALNYLHSLEKEVEYLASVEYDLMENYEIRNLLSHLKEYNYIKIKESNFYIEQLKKYIER